MPKRPTQQCYFSFASKIEISIAYARTRYAIPIQNSVHVRTENEESRRNCQRVHDAGKHRGVAKPEI